MGPPLYGITARFFFFFYQVLRLWKSTYSSFTPKNVSFTISLFACLFQLISWKESVEVKDDEGFCMMKQLIEKFPEVAKVFESQHLFQSAYAQQNF